jgi:hypothetical protein
MMSCKVKVFSSSFSVPTSSLKARRQGFDETTTPLCQLSYGSIMSSCRRDSNPDPRLKEHVVPPAFAALKLLAISRRLLAEDKKLKADG